MATEEERVRAIIEEAIEASPWPVISGMWGVAPGESANWRYSCNGTCPMGAVLMLKQPEGYTRMGAVAKALGVTDVWVALFTQGFDGHCKGECTSPVCKMGQEFRAKFLPKENEKV
jgi:hypothetical protein